MLAKLITWGDTRQQASATMQTMLRASTLKDCHVYSVNKFNEMQLERLVSNNETNDEKRIFATTQEAIDWLISL